MLFDGCLWYKMKVFRNLLTHYLYYSIMEMKTAFAGTLESGDVLIQIVPTEEAGLKINLDSTVAYQFGDQIKKVIADTLKDLGIENAMVNATDKGALDCTIRARVTAAAVRATGKDVWKD